MTETHYFFVNGIRTRPEKPDAWTDLARMWCRERGLDAHTYEYWSFAVTRWVRERERGRTLAVLIDNCTATRKVLVGHSNGCDVILRALTMCKATIAEIHLIAGACDERFTDNGLNEFLVNGKVGRVWVWWSRADRALQAARLWTGWMRPFHLGYGWLGLVGPQEVAASVAHRVCQYVELGFDHSDYFNATNFPATMRKITGVWP